MEIQTSRKLATLLSFICLCFLPGDLAQIEMPQRIIEVIKGQMVVLQASYRGSAIGKDSVVVWNFVDPFQSRMVISYTAGQITIGDQRVNFTQGMPNNDLSLFINNTKESDSGRYVCQVIIPAGSGVSEELNLNVKVPPAPPVCKVNGKPTLKGNVTLTCHSASGKPVPKYKWTKTSPSSEVFFSPMLNETLGTLKLNNLSRNMSGKYVCKATNTAGEESCYINLDVITSTNVGVIAGATVGSVVGVVLIVLFVVFIWTRRRDTEEDLANDIKEDAMAPKRVSWAKSGGGSDIISRNGTLSSVHTSPHPRDHHYPRPPASDTASITTAAGSTAGYRPRPQAHGTPERALPGFHSNPAPPRAPSANGGSLPRTDPAQPQVARLPHQPVGVTAANISRMGGVPIMVPAQNQAGSLV